MKSDDVYIHHIAEAVRQIEQYVAGMDAFSFTHSRLTQDAVARQLEIVGEASRRLSDEFRARYAEIPWRSIIGMRNRIVHDYLNIDLQVIWEIIQHDLPELKRQFRTYANVILMEGVLSCCIR